MRDEFFGVVGKKQNSTDCCALKAPLFLAGKGKDKAAGDKQKSNQLIHPPLALGWASDTDLEPPNLHLRKPSRTDWATPALVLPHVQHPKHPNCPWKSLPEQVPGPLLVWEPCCEGQDLLMRSSCKDAAQLWEVFLTLSMKSSKIWSILVLLLCVNLTTLYSWEKFPQVKMSEIYGYFFSHFKIKSERKDKKMPCLTFPFFSYPTIKSSILNLIITPKLVFCIWKTSCRIEN